MRAHRVPLDNRALDLHDCHIACFRDPQGFELVVQVTSEFTGLGNVSWKRKVLLELDMN